MVIGPTVCQFTHGCSAGCFTSPKRLAGLSDQEAGDGFELTSVGNVTCPYHLEVIKALQGHWDSTLACGENHYGRISFLLYSFFTKPE